MITRWSLMRCSRPIIRRTATSRRWVDVKPRRDGGSHATKIGRSLPILRFVASFPTVIEASSFQTLIYGCPTLSRKLRFSPIVVGSTVQSIPSLSVGDLYRLSWESVETIRRSWNSSKHTQPACICIFLQNIWSVHRLILIGNLLEKVL